MNIYQIIFASLALGQHQAPVETVMPVESTSREVTIEITADQGDELYWKYVGAAVWGGHYDLARVNLQPGINEFNLTVPAYATVLTVKMAMEHDEPTMTREAHKEARRAAMDVATDYLNWRCIIPLEEGVDSYSCEIALEDAVLLTGQVKWFDGSGASGIIRSERAGSTPFGGGWQSRFKLMTPKGQPLRVYVMVSRLNPLRPAVEEGWTITIRFPVQLTAEQTAESGDIGIITAPELGEPASILNVSVTGRKPPSGPERFATMASGVVLVSPEGVTWNSWPRPDLAQQIYSRINPDDPEGVFVYQDEVFVPPGTYYIVPQFGEQDPEIYYPIYDAIRIGSEAVLSRLEKVTLAEGQTATLKLDNDDIHRFIEAQQLVLDAAYGERAVPRPGELTMPDLAPEEE